MIAVIADDYTGAAEIGGIGLRHGLKVAIETEPVDGHDVDILIIATDTRSLKANEASVHIANITRELLKLNPDFIYKKVDSVLRGNITAELVAQMEVSHKNKTVLVAANPVFKRIIKNGIYYIDEIPLNKTCFSTDPQYPILSSSVTDIIGTNSKYPVINVNSKDKLPEKGLFIGDVLCVEDLNYWANTYNDNTLLAGASGFFNAILEKFTNAKLINKKEQLSIGETSLFVLGSSYPKDIDFFKNVEEKGYYISNMPKEIYYNKDFDPSCVDLWVSDVLSGLSKQKKVVASINYPLSKEPGIAFRINNSVGKMVKQVTNKAHLDELLIEGGSTTFMVLNYLGIKKLIPESEIDIGVIRMNLKQKWGFYLTTKPGSYYWPEDVWVPIDKHKFNNIAYD